MKDNKTIAELTSELVAQVEKLLHELVALVHNSRSRSTIVLYSRIRGSP